MESNSTPIQINRGTILVYRVFDVADEIDLAAVERKLSQQTVGDSRVRLARPNRQAIVVRNAPVRINLGETELQIRSVRQKVEAFATVWDYGVFSICFQLPIPKGSSWSDLVLLGSAINEDASYTGQIDAVAAKLSGDLAKLLNTTLTRPNDGHLSEDYTIYFLEEISGISQASELASKVDIPALILAEPKEKLAEKSAAGILDQTYQYAVNDLTVIDWNSAIVLEPSGQRDIADIIEFALTQLLEVRYYDDLLDRRLAELYDEIEINRQSIWKSSFSRISREANTRYLEFSEVMERVDNSLKVVGDFYLAVVFRAATRRFRIQDWQQSITRKMNMLARVSELLLGETNVVRSHLLEVIVILLILFETISAILRAKS